ncbi:MAG: alpha/beta hydrolase, partial [Variovorax sp.]|nr:alpha/beta hydrolase [Variovorax sp.]
GAHALTTQRSRAEVDASAVMAARSGNAYGEGLTSVVTPAQGATLTRSAVRAEAYATAHAPVQNVGEKAFVSTVASSQHLNGSAQANTAAQSTL